MTAASGLAAPLRRRRPSVSLPREHGALVTALGAALLAVLVAPAPGRAACAGLAVLAAFVARGPIERRVGGARPRRHDRAALAALASLALASVGFVALEHARAAAVVGGLVLAVPAAGALARARSLHRKAWLEALGMAVLSASAGAMAYGGGLEPARAAVLAGASAFYGAAAVPIVRPELRRADQHQRGPMTWLGLGILSVGAACCVAVAPALSLAFAPRLVHVLVRAVRGGPRLAAHAPQVGARECVELLAFLVGLWLLGV